MFLQNHTVHKVDSTTDSCQPAKLVHFLIGQQYLTKVTILLCTPNFISELKAPHPFTMRHSKFAQQLNSILVNFMRVLFVND